MIAVAALLDEAVRLVRRLDDIEIAHPWFLLLVLPGLAAIWWRIRRRSRTTPALVYPSVARFAGLPRTLRQRLLVVPPLLEAGAVVFLCAAAARPRLGHEETVVRSEGIAIQMVLDRSGSMEEEMSFEGRQRRRVDIVREVFEDFVVGNASEGGELPGRPTDLIGLTTFARFTEESCPLVARHEPLIASVRRLQTVPALIDRYGRPRKPPTTEAEWRRLQQEGVRENPLNRTAIGDGLMRAIYSLVAAEDDIGRGEDSGGYKIQGKVIVLLTDGENNAGDVDPIEAGRYAAENDIRVYYVLLREPYEKVQGLFQTIRREIPVDRLLEVPRAVAGDPSRAFLATDGDALRRIYEEIDRLERTEIGKTRYSSYEELYHWLLVPGFALAFVAFLLGETYLRRTP